MRWVSCEVDYVRYESPSEMFHSLIFETFCFLCKDLSLLKEKSLPPMQLIVTINFSLVIGFNQAQHSTATDLVIINFKRRSECQLFSAKQQYLLNSYT